MGHSICGTVSTFVHRPCFLARPPSLSLVYNQEEGGQNHQLAVKVLVPSLQPIGVTNAKTL
jgi:hypothetical protein